jgi:cation diffusion facilitator CzcD-associated flavoprotein CzcO
MLGRISMGAIDVAVIGAGPYGLSLGAHLRARGVDFRIFGEPMGAWRHNMPEGMLLKSYSWASNLSAPTDPSADASAPSGATLRQFCADNGILYNDTLAPIALDTFVGYGETFQRRLVPFVERKLVTALYPTGGGFRLRFEDGDIVDARRVIVAVGLAPFRYLPPFARHLPPEVASHSADYGPLDRLDGKEVVIVGSGSSATDLAGLLHERGISVSLVVRAPTLSFANPPRTRSLAERLLAPTGGIGNGWALTVCASAPGLVHLLPPEARFALMKPLGPLGGAFMKERVVGKVPLRLGRVITDVTPRNGKIHLRLAAATGTDESLSADHVVFATGYAIDLDRLSFLPPTVLSSLSRVGNAPHLSRHYESSLPGLHFVGPAAASSFGPVSRFVFGTRHAARHLAHYLPAVLGRRLPMPLTTPVAISADPAVPL